MAVDLQWDFICFRGHFVLSFLGIDHIIPPLVLTLNALSFLSSFRFHTSFPNIYTHKMPVDLLHPSAELEARTHKLKRLVQSPNSYFMDIKCPGCFQITTVFSHAQSVVLCGSCNVVLCQPTGGRARLTDGCSFRKKVDWTCAKMCVRLNLSTTLS